MKGKVGRKHIRRGETVSLSRMGNLKPSKAGENIVGTARTYLPARRLVDMEPATGKISYSGVVDPDLTDISISYMRMDYVDVGLK